MHDLQVGDRVRVLRAGYFKGNPKKPGGSYKVAEIAFVTKIGSQEPGKWDSVEEMNSHVVINLSNVIGSGTWIDTESLEKYDEDAESKEIEAALASISEAAKHQEHVLMFKSIIIADSKGKELKVSVVGQEVYLEDEYADTVLTVDLDAWINLQEVVDLAFRQIDPMHTGKEKK